MQLIGVISDTHGMLRSQVKEIFKDCDLIIHAGDIGNIDILNELKKISRVIAIKGNVDRSDLTDNLNYTEQVEFISNRIYIIHDLSKLSIDPKAKGIDIVIYGHSHKAEIKKINNILYFNPGSAGPRRFKLPITAGLLKVAENKIEPEIIELKAAE